MRPLYSKDAKKREEEEKKEYRAFIEHITEERK